MRRARVRVKAGKKETNTVLNMREAIEMVKSTYGVTFTGPGSYSFNTNNRKWNITLELA